MAAGLQVGLGVRPGSAEIIQTQGEIQTTGNPLDIAIQGAGFFQIELPSGHSDIPAPARSILTPRAIS